MVALAGGLVTTSCLVTSSLDELRGNPGDGGAGSCGFGYQDCDGDPDNGCETNLSTSPQHCGACGKQCPNAPSAAPACVNGQCDIACDLFTGNCDGNAANGCETPIEKDSANCGTCGNVCGSTNAVESACEQGECKIVCADGFGDCDGSAATACETDLTGPENCGACNRGCLGAGCSNAQCEPLPLATGLPGVSALVVSGGLVYLATNQPHACGSSTCWTRQLVSVPVTGGDPTLELPDTTAIEDLAADGSGNLYLATGNAVARWAPGGEIEELAANVSADALELDATHVYFVGNGRIQRVPLAGGAPQVLVDGGVDDDRFALGGGSVYFYGKWLEDGIQSVPAAGGTVTVLYPTNTRPRGMTADAAGVYWTTDQNPGSVLALVEGSLATVAQAQERPQEIVTDGTTAWWWNRDASQLMRAPVAGGSPSVLSDDQGSSDALLALDAEAVYWLRVSGGSLRRIAR